MDKKDGGPAFPCKFENLHGKLSGMTLRDWFAGQALAGLLSRSDSFLSYADPRGEKAIESAYEYADAMLAHREKGVQND